MVVTTMNFQELKVGDRIRIISVPGIGIPNYTLHSETRRAYKKLIARGRSLRICEINEYRSPWFRFRFKRANEKWEYHSMNIMDSDDNWVLVKRRRNKLPG